jgi:hypothetical protein
MNQGLLALFSYKEVKHTLFSIGDWEPQGRMGFMLFFINGFGIC